jgi:hypothetical protein
MGDGALIMWDETNEAAIDEALFVFNSYAEFLNDELFKPFDNLSLAGALVTEKIFKYEISAELSELKYRDYVGYGINLACRLQALAHANELILNELLTKSVKIPFRVDTSPQLLKELHLLKGLKDEDRTQVLFYDQQQKKA